METTTSDAVAMVNWTDLQRTLRNQLKPYGLHGSSLLTAYEPHKRRLVDLVKRSTFMSESNSVLIIGPRGSGKSALLDSVVQEVDSHPDIKDNLICIFLNGLVHTDDNIALKDIMEQLQMVDIGEGVVGSFSEKLTLLLEALRCGSKQSKSILFVLDEFDLFCHHKEQTLLYNLFDIAQSQQSPICVIGLSCRPDVLSKLENRVRSRFSHQQIYLFEQMEFSDFVSVVREVMCLPVDFSDKQFMQKWNGSVEEAVKHQTVQDVLKKCFNYSCSIRDLKRYLLHVLMLINPIEKKLKPSSFIDAFTIYSKDSKISVVHGLSILEISLIIAMMHLTELYDGEPFNFEMVYHEYKKFLQKKMNLNNLDKAVVMKALEHLLAIELVKEVSESSGNNLKRFAPVRLMLESNQIKDALNRYPNLPFQLQQWSLSCIIE